MANVHRTTSHTYPRISWCFAGPGKSWPIALVVSDMCEGVPRIYFTSQAFEIFPPCIHKVCEIYGNLSMDTCISHHIPHIHVGPLVVCRSFHPWAHILGGLWRGWRASICMDCSPCLSDHSYTSTRHAKRVPTNPWLFVPCITSHTYPMMAWWFINPTKSWPIASVVSDMDEGFPRVYFTSQAFEIFPMYPQGM